MLLAAVQQRYTTMLQPAVPAVLQLRPAQAAAFLQAAIAFLQTATAFLQAAVARLP
jgi:hypothetical protein